MAQHKTIFYSWQSDLRAAACRTLIEDALVAAAKDIGRDSDFDVEPVVDRDTQGLSGAPNIRDAIFAKIERAEVLAADVTPIGNAGPKQRPTPNPSVSIELGYAIKTLGWQRIILVLNTAYGRIEELPFDIRGHRVFTYASAEDAEERSLERRKLQAQLRDALASVLQSREPHPGAYPAELKLTYSKERITQEHHDYRLNVALTNKGTAAIKDWSIVVEIPRVILPPFVDHFHERKEEGSATHALFRFTPEDSPKGKTLYQGVTEVRSIGYHMTSPLVRSGGLQNEFIRAKAYMNDQLVGEVQLPFDEWQDF